MFAGLGRDELQPQRRGLRKGHTAVIPAAVRVPPRDEKGQGFVQIEQADLATVRTVPAPLPEALAAAARAAVLADQTRRQEHRCSTCGAAGGLVRCAGCSAAWYCGKVSSRLAPFSRGFHACVYRIAGVSCLTARLRNAQHTGLPGQRVERRRPQERLQGLESPT